jgi:hypothetical protein
MQDVLLAVRGEERLQCLPPVGPPNVEQDCLDVCWLSGNTGSAEECFAVTVQEADEDVTRTTCAARDLTSPALVASVTAARARAWFLFPERKATQPG